MAAPFWNWDWVPFDREYEVDFGQWDVFEDEYSEDEEEWDEEDIWEEDDDEEVDFVPRQKIQRYYT